MAHKKKVSIRKKKKKGKHPCDPTKDVAAQVDKGHLVSSLLFFFFPFCVLSEAKRRAELPEEAFNHKLKVLL